MRKELRRLAMALAIGFPMVSLFSTGTAIVVSRAEEATFTGPPWQWSLLSWSLWALFTPLVIRLIERVPMWLHVVLILGVGAAQFTTHIAIRMFFEELGRQDLLRIAASCTKYAFLNYGVIAAAVFVLHQQRLARVSSIIRSRLERRLVQDGVARAIFGLDSAQIPGYLDEIARSIERNSNEAERRILLLCSVLRQKLSHRVSTSSGEILSSWMPAGRALPDSRRLAYWCIALFPLFGVYNVILDAVFGSLFGGPAIVRGPAQTLAPYVLVGAFWPGVAVVVRRFIAGEKHWRRNLLVVSSASFAHAMLAQTTISLLRAAGIGLPARWFEPALVLSFTAANLLCSAVYAERRAAERLRSQAASRDLTRAQLKTLRSQLDPHFLFNSLNSILSLVDLDRAAAQVMLAKLRRVLQLSLREDSQDEVRLADDLDLTISYLDIERVRFRDALDLTVEVDPALHDAVVPSFLLQPLIENAVRHGALASRGRGSIVLRATRTAGDVTISVDNDCDLLLSDEWREGVGLSNIRKRLRYLYGDRHQLTVARLAGNGFSVRIRLPFRAIAFTS